MCIIRHLVIADQICMRITRGLVLDQNLAMPIFPLWQMQEKTAMHMVNKARLLAPVLIHMGI